MRNNVLLYSSVFNKKQTQDVCENVMEHLKVSSHKGWVQSIPRSTDGAGYVAAIWKSSDGLFRSPGDLIGCWKSTSCRAHIEVMCWVTGPHYIQVHTQRPYVLFSRLDFYTSALSVSFECLVVFFAKLPVILKCPDYQSIFYKNVRINWSAISSDTIISK